jgi:hypothetical protein
MESKMIKPLFHGVEFHPVLDNMFSLSKGYRFQNDDLVFGSYKQVWWSGSAFQRYRDGSRETEYFDSLDQFLNKPDIKNWLNEI